MNKKRVHINKKLYKRIVVISKYMNIDPTQWIEQKLYGQLSRFTYKV